jgi:uncharacterized membrane protein
MSHPILNEGAPQHDKETATYWRTTLSITVAYAACLFCWSAYRHTSFRSEAYDLGIFDQALWLISRGEVPFSSLLQRHILGDHFALILYPLSIFYWISPSVHWLFLVQALSLSCGGPLLYCISRRLNANPEQAVFVAIAYFCHPIITNSNLFDFHPECLAVPFLLAAVLCALRKEGVPFFLLLILSISCKEIISLSVVGLGLVLCTPVFSNRKTLGILAVLIGTISFVSIPTLFVPMFNVDGTGSSGMNRYGPGLGFQQLILKYGLDPGFFFSRIPMMESLIYLCKLLLPYSFALVPGNWWVLIGASPTFLLNCLSDLPIQRNLRYQYDLPILPFLGLLVAVAVSRDKLFYRNQRILLLALVLYLTVPILGAFVTPSSEFPHAWRPFPEQHQSLKSAVTLIPEKGSILAPSYMVPHLSHRHQFRMLKGSNAPESFVGTEFVLINTKNPGWLYSTEKATELVRSLTLSPDAANSKLLFTSNEVYLFALSPGKNAPRHGGEGSKEGSTTSTPPSTQDTSPPTPHGKR